MHTVEVPSDCKMAIACCWLWYRQW